MNVQVNPDEDTEWNDILRAHGVIPQKELDMSDQIEEALQDAVTKAHESRLEDKTLEELDDLEDEEDEDFLESYRQKRMAEIKDMVAKEVFGEVVYISKPEYSQEITDASEHVFVFVHIAYPMVVQSKLLSGLFERLAPKFKDVKFVQIDARQINDKYPSESCPTVLVYHKKKVIKQWVTLAQFGGNSASLKDIESMLVEADAVKRTDRRLIVNEDGSDDEEKSGKQYMRF